MMASRLSLVGLLLSVAVTGLRRRKAKITTEGIAEEDLQEMVASLGETVEDIADDAGCGNWMPSLFHTAVKAVTGMVVEEDPLDTIVYTNGEDIDLLGCAIRLPIEARLLITGLSQANVEKRDCKRNGEDMIFSANVTLSNLVEVAASLDASFKLCGLPEAGRHVNISLNTLKPGMLLSVVISVNTKLNVIVQAIAEAIVTNLRLGEMGGFKCGLYDDPGFVGSKMEQWCANLIGWLANGVQNRLQGAVDKAVAAYIVSTIP